MKGHKAGHHKHRHAAGATPRVGTNLTGSDGADGFARGGKTDCMASGGVAKKHLGKTSAALHGTAPMAEAATGKTRRPMKDGGVTEAGHTTPPPGKKEKNEEEDAEDDSYARGGGIHIKASHKGLLHKDLGVASGSKIPAGKLAKAANSSDPAVRKRAVFAENAKKWHHG